MMNGHIFEFDAIYYYRLNVLIYAMERQSFILPNTDVGLVNLSPGY